MNPTFAAFVERLHPSYERLMRCAPVSGGLRLEPSCPTRAVYLFSEGEKHLYVGRTNRLRTRHHEHWKASGSHNDAPFAFKLAREATSNLKAKGGPTRKALENVPAFKIALTEAKQRIAKMDFRWVEEKDPSTQCLLEIYVAISLGTPYNDFENH